MSDNTEGYKFKMDGEEYIVCDKCKDQMWEEVGYNY
jgi:hypothetical protein